MVRSLFAPWKSASTLLSVVLAAATVGGCAVVAGDNVEPTQDKSSSASAGQLVEADVDPQVLQDVIDGALWMPGASVRRGMRVQMFAMSMAVQECGGQPVPLTSTEDRPAQNLYPDLDLIRDRGFAENGPSYRDSLPPDCTELAPDGLPSWGAWRDVMVEWENEALTAQSDPSVAGVRDQMSQCLSERTGLEFSREDPTSFLLAVDYADIDGATDRQMKGFASAYADCGKPYFDTIAALLKSTRDDYIERHREALAEFAVQIADSGYVP